MGAYTLVDQATRRNMEAIVKTWKEPVPGSMDPRPVFPHEVVQPIENALIKAKTVALQSGRPGQMQTAGGYRNTPTPPQYNSRFAAPSAPEPAQAQPYQTYPNHQVTPSSALRESPDFCANRFQAQPYQQPGHSPLPPTPQQYQQQVYAPPPQRPVSDVEGIKRDVASLIAERQAQFSRDPHNQDLQTQLRALLQLQTILNTQSLDPNSLQAIQRQISSLASQAPSTPRPAPQLSFPPNQQWQPQAPTPVPQPQLPANSPSLPYHQPPSAQPQPQVQPPAPTLPPGGLNSLQALWANGQKPSTPQIREAAPALQHASHQQLNNLQSHAAATPVLNGNDLLASLSKSGLLPKPPSAQPTPPVSAPAVAPTAGPQSTADLLKSLSGLLPPASQTGTPTLPTAQLANTGKPRVPMTSAALKVFRPELVHSLYDAHPNQCSTCGRRFSATNDGRAKKDRHLDWHFRTNQRMADPNTNRGQHRNWYIPEIDWIKLKEFDPSTTTAAESATNAADEAAKKKKGGPEDKFVRAPPGTTKATCNICFEEMKTSYSEELQDWIFPAATTYGGKIVHAQCLAEMLKGQSGGGSLAAALGAAGGQRQRSATPDSSLGKRKAESALAGNGPRVRMQ